MLTLVNTESLSVGSDNMKASEMTVDEVKELKKELKLPTTKQLIYYEQCSYQKFKPHLIEDFEIIKELPNMKVLRIELENGSTVDIYSDYLVEMQKSNFIQKMKENSD